MANKDVAKIDITLRIVGTVRMKEKGGRYKYYLYSEKFGPQFFNTREGQELLLAEMSDLNNSELPGQSSESDSENTISIESNEQEEKKTDSGWLL